MKIMDKAVIGMGEAEGHGCIVETAEAAIADPSIGGARCVLINVTGAPDMTLFGIDGRGHDRSRFEAPWRPRYSLNLNPTSLEI